MREAIVKLIYKKGKHNDLKNWRPISLLNTDYKILSKILALRLTPLFQKHILPNQNAGLPKRRIENIHLEMQALLEMAEQKNEKIGIMSIDFQKAFDTLSHQLIMQIMKKLRLGPIMAGFVELLYNNIHSKIEINGKNTQKIQIKRGIRQGCPLSMALFILCTDVFTRKIIQNELIKGITFQKINFKIAQFADDTTFGFHNECDIKHIMTELEDFEKISGLKINPEKTQIIVTDSLLKQKIQERFPTFKIQDKLKILGINFYIDQKNNKKNWIDIIPKIKGIVQDHENRRLTIFGKIQIIKTLIIPLLIHIARLIIPSEKITKEINQILFKFLWNNYSIEQLSRKKLIAEYKDGGITMVDLQSKIDTCFVEKIKYLHNIEKANAIWKQWALYNLFYKIKTINPKLFDNNKPHSLMGNSTWNRTFQIFMKLKKFEIDWENVEHKNIYLRLKELTSTKIEILSLNKKIITWKNINLQDKKIKQLFTNEEKEIIYRIATKAFK